jgi:hypothetical protein
LLVQKNQEQRLHSKSKILAHDKQSPQGGQYEPLGIR